MPGQTFRIQITHDNNVLTLPSHRRLMNDLYRGTMGEHWAKHLPKHFEDTPENRANGGGGSNTYNIQPRTVRWQRIKEKKGYPRTANVATGQMRQEVMARSQITATKDYGRIQIRNYFAMRPEHRAEIEAITPKELTYLINRMNRLYVRYSQSPEYARKRAPKTINP